MPLAPSADLTALNTLGLHAQADFLYRLRGPDDLLALQADPALSALPRYVLGGGSNLVLPARVPGVVLKVEVPGREIIAEDADAIYVRAGGGENWHDFVQWTLAHGLAGLENLALIPGTVGAAPIQNIGAYGVEVKDTLHAVHALDLVSGAPRVFHRDECAFAYRDSVFKQAEAGRWVIVAVEFRLPKVPTLHTGYGDIERELATLGLAATPQNVAQAVISVRRKKLPDPAQIGNAGSFFKNPIVPVALRDGLLPQWPELVSYPAGEGKAKLAAGWLIERAGWKGKRIGPVGMYEKQALVLVNHGGAMRDDVNAVVAQVQRDVYDRFGVQLEAEPVFW
ncbi:UDP-N-acetylmuramate dehydrogenase [Amantichitinum ursilacus]|uniref:UDP-N-acetylenolpyruvoylglucosamine reductase n=1 Tax=Amantichitinum ursilacus TaxID=857265 RepID=A0A0N0XI81_9NEIS|nr:UDP-N-acetylmuramate dehydrogenase [Amantichitinum ursilacus]KPC49428.1 UDP-N-acetylenolpyruvoylglucosamine reductase [Amantichitinum ursilacus]